MTLRPCGNPNCLTQTGQHVAGSSEERSCQHDGQSDARRAAGTATAAARAANPPERDTETLRRFAEDATVNGDAAAFFGATESQIALVLGENPDLWYPEGDEDDGDYRWTPREGFMEALAEKVGDDAADMGASFEKVGVASFETDPAKWTSDSQQADWCNQSGSKSTATAGRSRSRTSPAPTRATTATGSATFASPATRVPPTFVSPGTR